MGFVNEHKGWIISIDESFLMLFWKCLREFTQMFSEIDLISSYHYIDDLNSINIKHLEMFPVGADFWFHKIYKFNGYKWLIKMKNEVQFT